MIILMVYHAVWYCFGFGVFEKVLNFWRYGQSCELDLKVKLVSATGWYFPFTKNTNCDFRYVIRCF